jgi:hypothetical protein
MITAALSPAARADALAALEQAPELDVLIVGGARLG